MGTTGGGNTTIKSPVSAEELFGRSHEQERLLESLERLDYSSAKPELVLLSGPSGVGKTALATTLNISKVLFCSGKHDQIFQEDDPSNQPYGCWLAAFASLVPQIRDKATWLQQKLDEESQNLLADKIPALRDVLLVRSSTISDQRFSGDAGEQKRFLQCVCQFLTLVASPELPLVILLDDLQWADEVSLMVMETVVLEVANVRIVGTCRANEVEMDSPICKSLRRIEDRGATITNIKLDNLPQRTLCDMISSKYGRAFANSESLVAYVWEETNGNPFFANELLGYLNERGLAIGDAFLDASKNDFIMSIRGDVLVLVQGKIAKLTRETHTMLKVAACLGSEIAPELVQCLCKFPIDESLKIAVSKGLIVRKTNGVYQFAHDRIQQAVYAMISDRPAFHRQIGRHLWSALSNEKREQFIFVILRQLLRGLSLMQEDDTERLEFSSVCFVAGRRAAALSDFPMASSHLRMGLSMLGTSPWQSKSYELCLQLHNSAAEADYALGNFQRMDLILDSILENAKCFSDKVAAYSTQILSYGARSRVQEAFDIGINVLSELGERFPSKPREIQVLIDYLRTKWLLRGRSMEGLLRLPNMSDPRKLAAMQLMNLMLFYGFVLDAHQLPFMMMRMLRRTIQYGICAHSGPGFAAYGMLLCSLGNFVEGNKYGKLALEFVREFKVKSMLPRVHLIHYAAIDHWHRPLNEAREPLRQAEKVARETGDIETAIMVSTMGAFCRFDSGEPLPVVSEQLLAGIDTMEELNQDTWSTMIRPMMQAIRCFQGKSEDAVILTGEFCKQDELLQYLEEKNLKITSEGIYMLLMELAYIFGSLEYAEEMGEACGDIDEIVMSTFDLCHFLVFRGLVALALARTTSRFRRKRLRVARKVLRRMKTYALVSPLNYLSKLYLLEAEYAALRNRSDEAIAAYLSSIALAGQQGNLYELAIANERLGRFYLELDDKQNARSYLNEALTVYKQWGGNGKVRHLEEEMPFLFSKHPPGKNALSAGTSLEMSCR